MITKCPNCSALLDCPQEPGSNVDCAGCGNPFIAQPIPPENTPSAVNHASGDNSSSKKQRALNAIDQQIRQHEKIKRQKEIEQQDRLAAAERRKIEALRLGEKKYEDALAVAKISRGSIWAKAMLIIGIIALVLGVICFLIALGDSELFIPAFVSVASGLTCVFYAFLLNVFTDIRWLLALSIKQGNTNN